MLYHSTSFSILKSTTWVFLFIILPCSCINKDTNLFIDKGNLLSFKFEKRLNPQLEKDIELPIYTSHNKLTGYLTAPSINSSNLIASFSTEKGKLYINNKEQKSGTTNNDFREVITYTFKGDNGDTKEYEVRLVPYTGLPIIIINTDKEYPLKDRDNWLTGTIEIKGMNLFEDFKDSIEVKGRGNGTWRFPKKPFNVKLKNKSSILGMNKHKRWSFLANYRDRTLLRNDVTFHIGYIADNLQWTPKSQFAEVIFNGEYQGNFQICEQIRVDKNRVNIKELSTEDVNEPQITGGYLLEYDSYYDEPNKFKTSINNWPVNIKEPDEKVLNKAQLEYIENYTNTFEALLQAGEYEQIYNEYINIDSFIDYWLVQAIVGNREMTNIYSIYCYKDRNKKLYAGPLCDFDYTTFTLESNNNNKGAVWYKYLFQDPYFKRKAIERFQNLKPQLMGIADYIVKKASSLSLSEKENWKLWPLLNLDGTIIPNNDEQLSYEEAISRMKNVYQKRLEWIEQQLNN